MTGSRKSPELNQQPQGTSESSAQPEPLPLGSNEISPELSGITDPTSQSYGNAPELNRMNHKLNLVLRDLLKQKGQSARKAAKACGVPLSTFNGYLKPDRHQIDPNHLLAMAAYFGVSLDYLLSGRQQEPPLETLPTKKIFSRWVKLTIEEVEIGQSSDGIFQGGKK